MGVTGLGRKVTACGVTLASLLLWAGPAAAGTGTSAIDSGDTAWLLISTALVMLMTAPGLALFYGGLVGQHNVLSTKMHSFFTLCLVGVQWVVVGYSLAFGADHGGLIGSLDFVGLRGIAPGDATGTIPTLVFVLFQGMFAVITVALISGAFAERKNFKAFVLFSLLWATLIYDPLAHWVWGGGWLQSLGALDFAGGLVVHVSSGVAALVAALVVGRRKGASRPHNIPFVLMGAGLLWFGWFGFNAGSALAAGDLAALAFTTTFTSAATGGLAWALIEMVHRGRATAVGTASGVVAGLVGITPAAGFVTVPSALLIGATTAGLCYVGVTALKPRFGYDDTLDVFGIHGLGGIWGAIATGLLASTAVNPAGADGLVYGNPSLLVAQLASLGATISLAAVGTFVILKAVGAITQLRVDDHAELTGLDTTLHGEVAYPDLSTASQRLAVGHDD
jgi:Amt family ammonium transporter